MDPQQLFFLMSIQNNTRSFKNTNSTEIKLNIKKKEKEKAKSSVMTVYSSQRRVSTVSFSLTRLKEATQDCGAATVVLLIWLSPHLTSRLFSSLPSKNNIRQAPESKTVFFCFHSVSINHCGAVKGFKCEAQLD